jgi:hypothetical protein
MGPAGDPEGPARWWQAFRAIFFADTPQSSLLRALGKVPVLQNLKVGGTPGIARREGEGAPGSRVVWIWLGQVPQLQQIAARLEQSVTEYDSGVEVSRARSAGGLMGDV